MWVELGRAWEVSEEGGQHDPKFPGGELHNSKQKCDGEMGKTEYMEDRRQRKRKRSHALWREVGLETPWH